MFLVEKYAPRSSSCPSSARRHVSVMTILPAVHVRHSSCSLVFKVILWPSSYLSYTCHSPFTLNNFFSSLPGPAVANGFLSFRCQSNSNAFTKSFCKTFKHLFFVTSYFYWGASRNGVGRIAVMAPFVLFNLDLWRSRVIGCLGQF